LLLVKNLPDGCSQLNATHKSCGVIASSSMKWNFECCARERDYLHDRFTQQRNDFCLIKSQSRAQEPNRCRRIRRERRSDSHSVGTAAMPYDSCSAPADRVTAMTVTQNEAPLVRQGLHPGRETKWKSP
jgi:hypothetical protein